MKFDSPISADEVEALVRTHLESRAARVDVPRSVAIIEDRLAHAPTFNSESNDQPAVLQPRRRFGTPWKVAIAASLLVAAGWAGYMTLGPAEASAYSVIREAHTLLTKNLDRCYLVETDLPRAWVKRYPFLDAGQETVLWTRGDRFQVTTRGKEGDLKWGQDGNRHLWVTADAERGLQFAADDAPEVLKRARSYMALDLRRVARRFLEEFDLQLERGRAADNTRTLTVYATIRPGRQPQPFQSAVVELDAKTKTIRRLELVRQGTGMVSGRVTFTLRQQEAQPDAFYELGSQLGPGAVILRPDDPAEQTRLLEDLIGEKNRR